MPELLNHPHQGYRATLAGAIIWQFHYTRRQLVVVNRLLKYAELTGIFLENMLPHLYARVKISAWKKNDLCSLRRSHLEACSILGTIIKGYWDCETVWAYPSRYNGTRCREGIFGMVSGHSDFMAFGPVKWKLIVFWQDLSEELNLSCWAVLSATFVNFTVILIQRPLRAFWNSAVARENRTRSLYTLPVLNTLQQVVQPANVSSAAP